MNVNPNKNSNISLNLNQSTLPSEVSEENTSKINRNRGEDISWSKEENDKLKSLKESGLSNSEIAKQFPEKSWPSVCSQLDRFYLSRTYSKPTPWDSTETNKLKELVLPFFEAHKKINWKKISSQIPFRTPRQCSSKWRHLKESDKSINARNAKMKNKRSKQELTEENSTPEVPATKRRKLNPEQDFINSEAETISDFEDYGNDRVSSEIPFEGAPLNSFNRYQANADSNSDTEWEQEDEVNETTSSDKPIEGAPLNSFTATQSKSTTTCTTTTLSVPKTSEWSNEDDTLFVKLKNDGLSDGEIAKRFPQKSLADCIHQWKHNIEPDLIRESLTWTTEEMKRLNGWVLQFTLANQEINWKLISRHFAPKSSRECCNQWHHNKRSLQQENLFNEPSNNQIPKDIILDDTKVDMESEKNLNRSSSAYSDAKVNTSSSQNDLWSTASSISATTITEPPSVTPSNPTSGTIDDIFTGVFDENSNYSPQHKNIQTVYDMEVDGSPIHFSLTFSDAQVNPHSTQSDSWSTASSTSAPKTSEPSSSYTFTSTVDKTSDLFNNTLNNDYNNSPQNNNFDTCFDMEEDESPVSSSSAFSSSQVNIPSTQNDSSSAASSTSTTTTPTSTSFNSFTSTTEKTSGLFNTISNNNVESSTQTNNAETSSNTRKYARWDLTLKENFTNRIHNLMNLNQEIDWDKIGSEFPSKGKVKCRGMWKKTIEPKLKKEYLAKPDWSEENEERLRALVRVSSKDWIRIAEHFTNLSPTECRLYYTYKLKEKETSPSKPQQEQTPPVQSQFSRPQNTPSSAETFSNVNSMTGSKELSLLNTKLSDLKSVLCEFSKLPTPFLVSHQQQLNQRLNEANEKYNIFKVMIERGRGSKKDVEMINTLIQQMETISLKYTIISNHYKYYNSNNVFSDGPKLYNSNIINFTNLYTQLLSDLITPDVFQSQINRIYAEEQYQILRSAYVEKCGNLILYSSFYTHEYQITIQNLVDKYPAVMINTDLKSTFLQLNNDISHINKILNILSESKEITNISLIEPLLILCLKNQLSINDLYSTVNKVKLKDMKIKFLEIANENPNQEMTLNKLNGIFKKHIRTIHSDKGGSAELTVKFTGLRSSIVNLVSSMYPNEKEIKF